jgi:hypothetical protein
MQKRGNRDENLCQEKLYDADVDCVIQNGGKLRQNFVTISMVVQNKNWLLTNYFRIL